MKQAIQLIESQIPDRFKGLPEEVFLFVSRVTPLLNVDLLIQNADNETLLTWRDDGFGPSGWHIPGGIVRYKELIADRIHAVAASELGARVSFSSVPLAMKEVIHPSRIARGHFLSLLYKCTLTSPLDESLRFMGDVPREGQWAWHRGCPADVIPVHEMYREFMCVTPGENAQHGGV